MIAPLAGHQEGLDPFEWAGRVGITGRHASESVDDMRRNPQLSKQAGSRPARGSIHRGGSTWKSVRLSGARFR